MAKARPHFAVARRDQSRRPVVFLVSTTTNGRPIGEAMGLSAYSYHFVVEALGPVLDMLGSWRLVDHPESRLAFAAARAEAEGLRPIHLSVNPLQDAYLSPALPNVVFPFWEFPDLPDRDFGTDTRQNWLRVCRGADLILTACEFTADAFRKAGVDAPVAVVPVPVGPEAFRLPPWEREEVGTIHCRHEVLGPPPAVTPDVREPERAAPDGAIRGAVRSGFRRVAPWLNPRFVARATLAKRAAARALRRRPDEFLYVALRDGYRNLVRRWLSAEAVATVTAVKRKALAALGREPVVVPDPPLPSGDLTVGGGLVYLTVFNLGDRRKNHSDILTAFLHAFRDRADVTLVIKLVTNRLRESHEAGVLRETYRGMGVRHACRVVVVTEFLDEPAMAELYRLSTFYVNASHAEGACLPLMRALAGGRPAIAPAHTAMADYMNEEVGFVPRSFPEPAAWPHDPEQRLETFRERLVWSDLRDAFLESAGVADEGPWRYEAMAAAARERMLDHAGRPAAARALRRALDFLPEAPAVGLGRASASSVIR